MILMKFGGSSLGTSQDIQHVGTIIAKNMHKNPVIVASALKGVTDLLENTLFLPENFQENVRSIVEIHKSIQDKLGIDSSTLMDKIVTQFVDYAKNIFSKPRLTAPDKDRFLSFGERLSVILLSEYLKSRKLPAMPVFSDQLGFITNARFGEAEIIPEGINQLKTTLPMLDGLPIITGFIGKTTQGITTTLGRSGSDYSATVIGSIMNVSEIQIWTNVDGVLTADPNVVEEVFSVPFLTFAEASELAYFGTKFLHPKCILPAMKNHIPIRILTTQYLGNPGTLISGYIGDDDSIKSIVYKKNLHLLKISSTTQPLSYGFLVELFQLFQRYGVKVDSVATTETSVSLIINQAYDDKPALYHELENIGFVSNYPGKAIISIIGEGLKSKPKLGDSMKKLLEHNNVHVDLVSQNTRKINLSFIIDQEDVETAVKSLHNELFLEYTC